MRQRLLILIAVFSVASIPVLAAQGRGNAGGARGPKTTTHGPRATSPGAKTTTRAPKTTAAGAKSAARGPKAKNAGASAAKRGGDTAKTREPKTTTTPRSADTTASALPRNSKLVERLRLLLPDGTDMNTAAQGFRNQGQFVAAVHVSENLNIPFSDLKTRIVTEDMSLGQAIQTLRPNVDSDRELRRATQQADDDLRPGPGNSRRPRQ